MKCYYLLCSWTNRREKKNSKNINCSHFPWCVQLYWWELSTYRPSDMRNRVRTYRPESVCLSSVEKKFTVVSSRSRQTISFNHLHLLQRQWPKTEAIASGRSPTFCYLSCRRRRRLTNTTTMKLVHEKKHSSNIWYCNKYDDEGGNAFPSHAFRWSLNVKGDC